MRDNLLHHAWLLLLDCSLRSLSILSCRRSIDLSKLLIMLFKLLSVDLLLQFLGLFFLHNCAVLRNLLNVELVLSLELVGSASYTEQNSKENDGEEPASDGVPGESVRLNNAEG